MPFDSKTGADAGLKYGKQGAQKRWGNRDPASKRDKALLIKVSSDELAMITAKAGDMDMSRTELIVRAVEVYVTD